MKPALLLTALIILLPFEDLMAQSAFDKTRISITGHRILTGNTLIKNWDASNGIGFELSAPYSFGNFEAGLRYVRFDEFSFENSGFHSHYVFAGWHYSYRAGEDLIFTQGFRLGNNFMLHDQDKIYADEYKFSREESEFSYELFIRLQLEVGHGFEVYFSTAYNRIIFNIPLASYYGTVGVTLTLDTPNWLRNFLR